MDTAIVVQVFDWRGEVWLTVDRVHRAAGRRNAPRDRLASFHAEPLHDLLEDEALLWLHQTLALWVNAGCPYRAWADREAVSAPPGGGHGGRRVAPRDTPNKSLPSKTETPADKDSGAEGVSIQFENREWEGMLRPTRADLAPRRPQTNSRYTD